MDKKKIISWILQIFCAAILIHAGYSKLSGDQGDIELFLKLGMEPTGRIIIGILEILCGIFLITNRLAATGSFITIGVMCGAIIAHITVLGIDLMHLLLLSSVLTGSLTIAFIRRKEIPLIGNSLE